MVQNDPNYLQNIFLKKSNIGCIFSFVCETLWRAGRITMKFSPCMLHVIYRKNVKNTKIVWAALHCEFYIWNMKIFVTCHLIVVELFGDFETELLMTIQIVPNSFQINCSQNVRETAKISGTISFPYLESQLDPKYLNESETDKMLFRISCGLHFQSSIRLAGCHRLTLKSWKNFVFEDRKIPDK